MARAVAELVVEATADVSDAKSNLRSLDDTLALVSTAAGIVASAMVAAGAALVSFAQQADQQQQQINRLAFALESAGLAADSAVPRLERMFTTMSRITGISDEELRDATTAFVNYAGAVNLSTQEVEKGASLVVDIAAQTGKSASEIARAVANAFAGNATAIGELVPSLRGAAAEIMEVDNAGVRGAMAMELLTEQFDGAAASSATVGTNMRVLKNEIGDLKQTIGNQVLASGEFANALRVVLDMVRRLDAELSDPSSGLSESLQNIGILFNAAASAMNYGVPVLAAWYDATVDATEALIAFTAAPIVSFFDALVTPISAVITLFTEGLGPAIDEIRDGFDRVGERVDFFIGAFGRAADSTGDLWVTMLGQVPEADEAVNQFGQTVIATTRATEGLGTAWQWVNDNIETAIARANRMLPDARRQVQELYDQITSFFEPSNNEPDLPTGPSGPEGPTDEDIGRKVKESATLLQAEREAAAQREIEAEQGKYNALLAAQKTFEQQRLELERQAAEERHAQAIADAERLKAAEIEIARKAAQEQMALDQKKANIASQAANSIVGALDIIADGEAKSGKERRKELGTTFAATGRGYILQAIPEFFINPGKAGALAGAGAGLIAFGASLGGRVFGSGGGGGGGGQSSAGGAGFGPGSSGLSAPTRESEQPLALTDLRGVTIVTEDVDSMRRLVGQTDRARSVGTAGAL